MSGALGAIFPEALGVARGYGVPVVDAEREARRISDLEDERGSLPNTLPAVASCEELLKQARGRGDEREIVKAAAALAAARAAHADVVNQREALASEIRKGVVRAYDQAAQSVLCAIDLLKNQIQTLTSDAVFLEAPELTTRNLPAIEKCWRELWSLVGLFHTLNTNRPTPDLMALFCAAVPPPVQGFVAGAIGVTLPRGLRNRVA